MKGEKTEEPSVLLAKKFFEKELRARMERVSFLRTVLKRFNRMMAERSDGWSVGKLNAVTRAGARRAKELERLRNEERCIVRAIFVLGGDYTQWGTMMPVWVLKRFIDTASMERGRFAPYRIWAVEHQTPKMTLYRLNALHHELKKFSSTRGQSGG